jgi:hypothetical protein
LHGIGAGITAKRERAWVARINRAMTEFFDG